jgi:hypothetical protein
MQGGVKFDTAGAGEGFVCFAADDQRALGRAAGFVTPCSTRLGKGKSNADIDA